MISSKKYKRFVGYVLVILMLFPLVIAITSTFYSGQFNLEQIVEETTNYCISPSMRDHIVRNLGDALAFDGEYWIFVATNIVNAVGVMLGYVVFKVLAFIPEMTIKFLLMGVRKDDE